MLLSIDQLTTVISGAPVPFLRKNEPAANLYFHLVLRIDGEPLSKEQEKRVAKYAACFVYQKGGSVRTVAMAKNRMHILAGLSPFCAPGAFARELRLVTATFARHKLGAERFGWQEKYDAFTVSGSQIERVSSYIRRQKLLEREESYASSWNRLASEELY